MSRPISVMYGCPACWRRFHTRKELDKHLINQGSEYFVK